MINAFLIRFLTIFTVVAGLYAAGCINLYESKSLGACILGTASFGFFMTFGYLVYVQTKNDPK